jgi:hypothetical protein
MPITTESESEEDSGRRELSPVIPAVEGNLAVRWMSPYNPKVWTCKGYDHAYIYYDGSESLSDHRVIIDLDTDSMERWVLLYLSADEDY